SRANAAAVHWDLPRPPPEPAEDPVPRTVLEKRLARGIDFPGLVDPKAQLGDVLGALSILYRVPIEIDGDAFWALGVRDVEKTLVSAEKPIPKMFDASVSTGLNKVLSRVRGPVGATYEI